MFSAVELWQAEGGCERVRGWVEELRAVKGFPHSNEWELVRGEICQSVRWPNAVCRKHLGAGLGLGGVRYSGEVLRVSPYVDQRQHSLG